MSNVDIKFIIDGKEVSQEEIRAVEYSRSKKVIDELISLGESVTYEGIPLTREEIDNIDLEKAKEALAETKERLGNDAIKELYKEKLELSDAMWREIAEKSPARENLQPCIIEVEAKGLSIQEFAVYFKQIEEKGGLAMASRIHPEHYYGDIVPGVQTIIETFGMYKEPSYWRLEISNDGYKPIELDADTAMTLCAAIKLASDGTDTKLIAMHQFKPTEDGLKIKLGAFLPEAAPKEMIEGHKWHFAVEFNNVLHYAAELANKN
ncbi:hypothetical protein [Brevibacillus brevis]|uniref:Uncharacterized protein n=1 Tax=Brevibacillus brevis TaxID=1393 RepID=A0ABY9SYW8_BREBE|nr:hypothetical protein [Brevibacillus brevis]WNC13025.1 hypothetical protein RGB73_20185 [Brevibacillus brevis]